MVFAVLKVLSIVVRSVWKSREARELLKQLFDRAKGRSWFKRRRTGWKGKAGLIGAFLIAVLTVASLLWMHQRLGAIEERLVTIEKRQKENLTSSE